MRKDDLINAVYDEYANGNDWEKALELITGYDHADLLSNAVLSAARKHTIPELRILLKQLRGIPEWKPLTRLSGKGVSE